MGKYNFILVSRYIGYGKMKAVLEMHYFEMFMDIKIDTL